MSPESYGTLQEATDALHNMGLEMDQISAEVSAIDFAERMQQSPSPDVEQEELERVRQLRHQKWLESTQTIVHPVSDQDENHHEQQSQSCMDVEEHPDVDPLGHGPSR